MIRLKSVICRLRTATALALTGCTVVASHARGALAIPQSSQSSAAPSSHSDVFRQAQRLIGAGNYDGAERLVEAHPNSTASDYYQVGKAYFDQEQWARAAKWLDRCLSLQPSNDRAHLLLGIAFRQLARPLEARTELLKAAQANPSSEVNQFMAGHQLVLMGKYEEALPLLYHALQLNPAKAETLHAIGAAQARLGNYALAETYYRKELALPGAPTSSEARAHEDLAYLLLLSHDPQRVGEGLRHAQRAVELNPRSASASYLLGKALLKSDCLKRAATELERCISLSPADLKPHFLLAQVFDRLGEKENAAREWAAFEKLQNGRLGSGMAAPELP